MANARRWMVAAAAVAAVIVGTRAAAQEQAKPVPELKQVPATGFVGIEGHETYAAYCAVCHGGDGRGDGPAAPALKMPVPDLTTIAKRHGKFDALALARIVMGSDKMPAAHGSVSMPIWGPIFKVRASDDRAVARLRAQNVVKHLESLQAK